MQITKMSKSILILLTVLTSLSSQAEVFKFSCDNEKEDTTVGEIYYEVSGQYSPERSTLPSVKVAMKEVQNFGDKVLGQFSVEKLKPESSLRNALLYSFSGSILRQTKNVRIIFVQDVARGLTAQISVNEERLSWCTPLHQ